jgi:hypothetical protein
VTARVVVALAALAVMLAGVVYLMLDIARTTPP